MTSIDCTNPGAHALVRDAQGLGRFHGNPQQRADQLVRAIVLHDFGQKAGGVQGLAASLRKALANSDVAGTELPDGMLKNIEASLKKAAQALADRGYEAKTIDATIDQFRAQLADALDKLAPSEGKGDDVPASGAPPVSLPTTPAPTVPKDATLRVDEFVAREVRRQKGAIDILTTDGDVVSIRFRTKDVVTGSHGQTSDANGTAVSARESVVSRGRLQIAVDGTLDDEELAAIGDLLEKVDALATKFFSGDVQAAFAAASDLGVDSDEIASYQLDLTYSRKVAIAASMRTPLPASGLQTQPGCAAPAQPPSQASASQQASGVQTYDAPAAAASAPTDSPSTSPDVTTPQPSEPAMPPATARKTIADYVGDVLSKLGSVDGAGRLTFSLRFKVSVLTTALLTLQPSSSQAQSPAANSTQLLTDSLDKAVA